MHLVINFAHQEEICLKVSKVGFSRLFDVFRNAPLPKKAIILQFFGNILLDVSVHEQFIHEGGLVLASTELGSSHLENVSMALTIISNLVAYINKLHVQ